MGRVFNFIYMPTALKFDLCPARTFPIGAGQTERSVLIANSGLGQEPVPFVSQRTFCWRSWIGSDRAGKPPSGNGATFSEDTRCDLDQSYLSRGAEQLGVTGVLERAMHGQTGGG
jgi:hypothetical protein